MLTLKARFFQHRRETQPLKERFGGGGAAPFTPFRKQMEDGGAALKGHLHLSGPAAQRWNTNTDNLHVRPRDPKQGIFRKPCYMLHANLPVLNCEGSVLISWGDYRPLVAGKGSSTRLGSQLSAGILLPGNPAEVGKL